jgi:hypothetical protein
VSYIYVNEKLYEEEKVKMKHKTIEMKVSELYALEGTTDYNPFYQRHAPVWTPEQRRALMHSIITDVYIPPIVLRKINKDKIKNEVIDGQQRLWTINRFFDNRFALGNYPDNPLPGKTCKHISSNSIKCHISDKVIPVCIVTDATDAEAAHQFACLNGGTPLSKAEIRNCIIGRVREVTRGLASHSFFENARSKSYRFSHSAICEQLLCLELHEGVPSDLRHGDMLEMHETYKSRFPGDIRKIVKLKLGIMDEIFTNPVGKERRRQPILKKGNIINLYLAVRLLQKKSYSFETEDSCDRVRKWFEGTVVGLNTDLRAKGLHGFSDVQGRTKVIERKLKYI